MKKPNFFIIGAPKCGTTTLAHMLSQNSNIYFSPQKEPHYFSTDIKSDARISELQYNALFEKVTDEQAAIGEGSVYYMYSRQAVQKIEDELPKSRYIVMLRHPVDMMISIHGQQIFSGRETIAEFAKAWRSSPTLREYSKVCKIGEQLKRLFATVDVSRILLLTLDELRSDPRAVYLKTCNFLDVPDDGRTEFEHKNSARAPRSQAVSRFIKRMANLRTKLGVPWLGGIGTFLIGLNGKKVERETLSPELLNEVEVFFADDVAYVKREFGIHLSQSTKAGG